MFLPAKKNTRQFINCKTITDCSLVTENGDEFVFFLIRPTNISVLSEEARRQRVFALMQVLKSTPHAELLALNSRESFENNKRYLRSRIDAEDNPRLRALLQQDLAHLNRVQVQTATAREFLLCLRLRGMKRKELYPYLNRVGRILREQRFEVRRADHEDIKRILAVYMAQNVTSEHFYDYDGERWFHAQTEN